MQTSESRAVSDRRPKIGATPLFASSWLALLETVRAEMTRRQCMLDDKAPGVVRDAA